MGGVRLFRRRRNEAGLCERHARLYLLHRAPRPNPRSARSTLDLGPLLPFLPLPPRSPSRAWGRGSWRSTTHTVVCVRDLRARWSGARLPTPLAYKVVPAVLPPDQRLGYSVPFRPTRNGDSRRSHAGQVGKLGGVLHIGALQAYTPGGPTRSLRLPTTKSPQPACGC